MAKEFSKLLTFLKLLFKFRKSIVIGEKERMVYSHIEEDRVYFLFEDHPNVIMQSTGLSDTERKEIYENDIVKIENELYVVSWDYRNACFILETKKQKYNNFREMVKSCKVVGNLVENAELLRTK